MITNEEIAMNKARLHREFDKAYGNRMSMASRKSYKIYVRVYDEYEEVEVKGRVKKDTLFERMFKAFTPEELSHVTISSMVGVIS